MAELEVEAVEEIDTPHGVDAPSCVLYGGKGGVGKTTMAAATGLASARDGTSTLVVSTDPAHSLADTFDRPIPTEPTRIDEEFPLYAVEIDPDEAMEQGVAQLSALGGGLGNGHPLADLLGGAVMPGADEAVALQQLMTYLDDDRFDRVIVDTAPTGHTLRLLALPEVLDTMVGRFLEIRERLQNLMEGMSGLFGDEPEADDSPGLGELRERIERLRSLLRDPARTDFRIVVIPETMSVEESDRLLAQLEEHRIPVRTIVVNRVMEDPSGLVEEIEPGAIVRPDIDGCEFCRQRWEVQRTALTRAQELFGGREIKRVPLFAEEVRGEGMLRLVAACLGE